MHTRIHWVVFDIDDVLVNIDTTLAGSRRRVFDAISQHHGEHSQAAQVYDELYDESFTKPALSLLERFKLGKVTETAFLNTIAQATARRLSMGEIRQCEINMVQGQNITCARLLAQLTRTCNVACFANTHTLHWEYMLRHYSFFQYMKVAMASHLSGVAKPDVAAYLSITKRLNAKPQTCLLIDDKETHIKAAQRLGWQTIQFHSADQLVSELCTLGLIHGHSSIEDRDYWNMTNA